MHPSNINPNITMQIDVRPIEKSRVSSVDWENLGFGRTFSDHMFIVDYTEGEGWHDARIEPYDNFSFAPSMSSLHYGQSIFEGMKAFRNSAGKLVLFRPDEHCARFNRSAVRMCMPEIPEALFMDGLKQVVALDKNWVKNEPGGQLYIRPMMFGTQEFLGVQASQTYRLVIFTCPVGAFYKEPVNVWVEDEEVRAAPGGVGAAKTAGNYARTIKIQREKQNEGYHVVLWLDAINHRFVEEYSTMNAFFVIDDVVITPPTSDTILPGITRKSAVKLLEDNGYKLQVRRIAIDEIVRAYACGKLQEAFGAGTAAVVSPVKSLTFHGQRMELPDFSEMKHGQFIKQTLHKMRVGEAEDPYHWIVPVN
ncbi:MAG: branched-chain amino acid aminotransferase [Bacteroidota bacterium]